jgi:hypothetical protein
MRLPSGSPRRTPPVEMLPYSARGGPKTIRLAGTVAGGISSPKGTRNSDQIAQLFFPHAHPTLVMPSCFAGSVRTGMLSFCSNKAKVSSVGSKSTLPRAMSALFCAVRSATHASVSALPLTRSGFSLIQAKATTDPTTRMMKARTTHTVVKIRFSRILLLRLASAMRFLAPCGDIFWRCSCRPVVETRWRVRRRCLRALHLFGRRYIPGSGALRRFRAG